jgi:quercetin dioxygenase-like cupin family protein
MRIKPEHWNKNKDGILNEKNMRNKLAARGYTVARYVYPPGTFFPEHSHDVDKIDGVLSGHFKMTMYGEEVILTAGDSLEVPSGAIHSAEVIGNAPVVSLDAIKK